MNHFWNSEGNEANNLLFNGDGRLKPVECRFRTCLNSVPAMIRKLKDPCRYLDLRCIREHDRENIYRSRWNNTPII